MDTFSEQNRCTVNNEYTYGFLSAVSRGINTRSEIADYLGVSVVTAGKIASSLLSCGVITEAHSRSSAPGRRPGYVRFSDDYVFVTVRITPARIRTCTFSPTLNKRYSHEIEITSKLFLDDVYITALRETESRLHGTRKRKVCGVTVICDGAYDGNSTVIGSAVPGLDGLDLYSPVSALFGSVCFNVINSAVAEIAGNGWGGDSDGCTVLIETDGNSIASAILINGVQLNGKAGKAGNIGEVRVYPTRTLCDVLRYANTPEEYASCLAPVLADIIFIMGPDRIVFCGRDYKSSCDTVLAIRDKLYSSVPLPASQMPEIIGVESTDGAATVYSVNVLRELWLKQTARKFSE